MTFAFALPRGPDANNTHPREFATRDLGGVRVAVLTRDDALGVVANAWSSRRHVKLAYCNAHLVNLATADPILRRQLAQFVVLADGVGVDLGAQLLYGSPFPDNLNGTDFTPELLTRHTQPLRVAMIGGKPGVAARAAEQLRLDHPQHQFDVLSHGYFGQRDEGEILSRLESQRPDLLLVAMGNPLQERWIAEKIGPQHCGIASGVGALFDFLAGEMPRAPRAVRSMRLEWVYRLAQEPRRLWWRYIVGNPLFLVRMLRLRLQGGKSA